MLELLRMLVYVTAIFIQKSQKSILYPVRNVHCFPLVKQAVPTFKIVSVPRPIFEAVVLALTAVLHARASCVARVKRKMQLLERVVLARRGSIKVSNVVFLHSMLFVFF
jgi:hypothetical protein